MDFVKVPATYSFQYLVIQFTKYHFTPKKTYSGAPDRVRKASVEQLGVELVDGQIWN